jgi:hypothetical protein
VVVEDLVAMVATSTSSTPTPGYGPTPEDRQEQLGLLPAERREEQVEPVEPATYRYDR